MKEILLAENSGFCFGVKQAMEKTEKEIQKKTTKRDRRCFVYLGAFDS